MNKTQNIKKVLLLDDQQMILTTLSRMIEILGGTVTTSTDGKDTLELYKNSFEKNDPFDLLILDISIDNGIGADIIIDDLLKIDPDVKAIVSSGDPNHDAVINYKERGFASVLLKPFTIDKLKDILDGLD
ncbi:MAG TPA: response regulator [Spirochaetota bacterium]|nr:response regulator [Spirochaetota bacterium]